jgi:hypothetical protein
MMDHCKLACLLTISAATAFSQVPSGWKVLHDKTNACQIAVPGDWTVSAQTSWIANAPADQGSVQLVAQPGKTVKPMNEAAQKALMVAKMIQNTPQVVLYASQPTKSERPITPYHAIVQGKGGTCGALIDVRAGVTEDLVKKITATLSATP